MAERTSLPESDPAALERAAKLTRRIVDAIAAAPDDVIGFDEFMALALYAPGLGYYVADNAIFGRGGDFVTAPESGTLFGCCVARQCDEILDRSGDSIIEYGAGSGCLALTLIEALHDAGRTQELHYHIVEPSASLRERQRMLLRERVPWFFDRVQWHADHPTSTVAGVIIANEVIDAMPARRYRVVDGAVRELGVAWVDAQFVWRTRAAHAVPAALAETLAHHADGYCCEYIPGMAQWFARIRQYFTAGVVLLSDYGYARHEFLHPSRSAGTLKCHYQHQVHDDPFVLPGLQDLTTAVNFSDLAEAADEAGLTVAGFTTQTRFLLACGIESIMSARLGDDSARDYALAQEAKRLLLPGEMGQTCKFLALAIDYDAPLCGFVTDERHRLEGFAEDNPA